MDNISFEALNSLISLLVKKAGYNIDIDYASEELSKTFNSIRKAEEELKKYDENEPKYVELKEILKNLSKRKNNFENNSEIIGKNIISYYKDNKDINEIKKLIEKLAIAVENSEDNEPNEISTIYNTINNLEIEYAKLEEKISDFNYIDNNSKEIDIRTKNYLESKINTYNSSIERIIKELEKLKEIEVDDKSKLNKTKIDRTENEAKLEKLIELKIKALNQEVSNEIWNKIESTENNIKRKSKKINETIVYYQELYDKTIEEINRLYIEKEKYFKSLTKAKEKVSEVNNRINNNDYIDYIKKIIDETELNVLENKIIRYKNKKDVVYVDSTKIKNEIITILDNKKNLKEEKKYKRIDEINKVNSQNKNKSIDFEKKENCKPKDIKPVIENIDEKENIEKNIKKEETIDFDW